MSLSPSYTKSIREAISRFEAEGIPHFTAEMIRQRLLEDEGLGADLTERRRIGDAIKHLKMKGELIVDGNGLRYDPKSKPSPDYESVYRVVRAYKGGFTSDEIARLSEIPVKNTKRIITSLEASGYIKETGYKERQKVWAATALCRNEPKPPAINYRELDYEQERRAVTRLVEVFLISNPKHPAAKKVIHEQLEILNRRFGVKGETDDSQKD